MRSLRTYTLLILTLCLSVGTLQAKSKDAKIDVTAHKVLGDGETLNTDALQTLIDKTAKKGGGTLYFPAGDYLTGTLQLRSHVNLHLDKEATILGSTNPYHYRALEMKGRPETPKKDDNSQLALLVAFKANNFTLSGEGTIDGQGRALALAVDSLHLIGERIDPKYSTRRHRPNETARPKLLRFSTCSDVTIKQLHMRNSSCWGLSFELCERLRLDCLDIFNRAYWNNDGMDITDSHNVQITNCNVNAGDDGICLKSYYPGYANDSIYIADCTVRSSASGVKFGTASYGGFKNIMIERVRVIDTFRSAIAIESVDGAAIENVRVKHMTGQNIGNAIFVRLGHRGGEKPGTVKDIHISDCNFQVAFGRPDTAYDLRGPAVDYFHNPIPSSIVGIPGYDIEGVRIENTVITYPGRASKAMGFVRLWQLDLVPEKIGNYPEFTMFGELPSWAFYMRHAKNVSLENVVLMLQEDDYRPAFVMDDVQGISMKHVTLPEAEHQQVATRGSSVISYGNLKDEFFVVPLEKK